MPEECSGAASPPRSDAHARLAAASSSRPVSARLKSALAPRPHRDRTPMLASLRPLRGFPQPAVCLGASQPSGFGWRQGSHGVRSRRGRCVVAFSGGSNRPRIWSGRRSRGAGRRPWWWRGPGLREWRQVRGAARAFATRGAGAARWASLVRGGRHGLNESGRAWAYGAAMTGAAVWGGSSCDRLWSGRVGGADPLRGRSGCEGSGGAARDGGRKSFRPARTRAHQGSAPNCPARTRGHQGPAPKRPARTRVQQERAANAPPMRSVARQAACWRSK
jgi:hypothetical protein